MLIRIDEQYISVLDIAEGKVNFSEHVLSQDNPAEALYNACQGKVPDVVDVLCSGPFTLVPFEEYTQDSERLLEHCYHLPHPTEQTVLTDFIPGLRSHIIFNIATPLLKVLSDTFPDTRINTSSTITPLLRLLFQHDAGKVRHRVYANCRQGHIDVMIFDEHKLIMLNTFETNTAADAVYYIIGLDKAIGLNLTTTPHFIVGNRNMTDGLASHLRRFITQVKILTSEDICPGDIVATTSEEIPLDLIAAHIIPCAS